MDLDRLISTGTLGLIAAQSLLIGISIFEIGGSWPYLAIVPIGGLVLYAMGYQHGEIDRTDGELETLARANALNCIHAATMRELDDRGELESVLKEVESDVEGLEIDWREVAERDMDG